MKSAKQVIQYVANRSFTVSELNADSVFNINTEALVSGRLISAKYTVSVEDLSNTAAVAIWVTQGQDWGEINAANSLYLQAIYNSFTGNGKLAAIEGPSVPKIIYCPSQIDTDLPDNSRYEVTAIKDIDELVDQGDNINVWFYGTSLANTLTTGSILISVEFEYEVAALTYFDQSLPRSKAGGMQVTILGVVDNDDNITQYFPPSNGRISNVRITIFGDLASNLGWEDSLFFGRRIFSDAQNTVDSIYSFGEGVILQGPSLTDVADPYTPLFLTTYSREKMFVKKGEPMLVRYQNTNTSRCIFTIEFDFIPDYNSQVNFWYSDVINNIADASINIFSVQIPFDMYLEKLHLKTRVNDLTIDSTQYLMAIKHVGELLSNIDMITGSLLSTTLIDNAQFSQLPSNILGVQAHGSTETIAPEPLEVEVYDYFPEGSWIVLVSTFESSGTEDLANILGIEGRSRVKSAKFGLNYLTGDLVQEVVAI